MEINFRKPSYLADHFDPALREDCILCLNRVTSKDLLAFFIVNEFVKLKDAACFVVSTTRDRKSLENIQSWIETFTELNFKTVHDLETLSSRNLKSSDVIGTSLDSLLAELTNPKPVMKNASLLLIDLTNDMTDASLLKKIRPIYEFCINAKIRFVILVHIHEILLTDSESIEKFFDMCHKEIQITANIACDSIIIGNNGNLVKVCINSVEDKNYINQSAFCIQKMIQECKELLSGMDKKIFTADENELLMKYVYQLELFYQRFGILAFAVAVDHFVGLLKKLKRSSELESFQLITECLQTKLFVIDSVLQSYLDGQQECSSLHETCISQNLEKVLHTLKLFSTRIEESGMQSPAHDKLRICIAFESELSTEIMLQVLQLLKVAPSYAFLETYKIFLLGWDWEDIFNEHDGHSIFVTTIKQAMQHVHKLTLNSAILFGAPKDYQELLGLKKLLRRRNGFLELIVPFDDQETKTLMKNFQEVEQLLLKRIPSYLDPDETLALFAESKHNLEVFQPDGHVCKITPEESINILNKYTQFLTYRRSNVALNHKTSFWRDTTGDLNVKTDIFLPAKSMVKDSIEAPILRFKKGGEQSTVYCTAVSRMASCLEACKMLYDAHELNENLEPTRRVTKWEAEPNEDDPILLSQKKWYRKNIPKLLDGSFPKSSAETFIYVIKTHNMTSCNAEIGDKYLGFCTTKKLPKMPSFLIYNRADTLIIEISELERTVHIKGERIHVLKDFHLFILNKVLKYNVHESSDAPGNKHDHGIVWTVLVKDGSSFSIDYDFLESCKVLGTECANQEPRLLNVEESASLMDAVILLRHKPNDKKFYFVNEEDVKRTVDDPFPNLKAASTYADYYQQRFGIDLQHGQALINLIPVHHNLNLLIQRYGLCSKSKSRQQLLVPEELCLLHPIPAHLWKQLVTIPVILYRLSCLLLVHELQSELCTEMCLSVPDQEPQVDERIDHVLHEAHILKKFSGFSVVENTVYSLNAKVHNTSECSSQSKSECDTLASEVPVERKKDCSGDAESRCSLAEAGDKLEKGPPNEISYTDTTEKAIERNTRDFQYHLGNDSLAENPWLKNKERKLYEIEAPPLSLILVAMTSPEAKDMFNYERLEFLGDAFINTLITIQLFLSNDKATEHILSLRKSAVVSNMSLYEMGEHRNIWRYELEEIFDFKTNPLIKSIIGHELEGEVLVQNLAHAKSDSPSPSTNDNSNVLKIEPCGTPSIEKAMPTESYISSSGTACNRNVRNKEPCRTSSLEDASKVAIAAECDVSSSHMKSNRNVLDNEPCDTLSLEGTVKEDMSMEIYDKTPSVSGSNVDVPNSESWGVPLLEGIVKNTVLKECSCETYSVSNENRTVLDNAPCKAPSLESVVKEDISTEIGDIAPSIRRENGSEAVVNITECQEGPNFDQASENVLNKEKQSKTKTNFATNQEISAASFEVAIRRKPIADSVEALVGLFYLWCGENVALDVMTWLGFDVCCIPRKNGATQIDQLNDSGSSYCDHGSFINENAAEKSDFPESTFDLEKKIANKNVSDFHICSGGICRRSFKEHSVDFPQSDTDLADVVDLESRSITATSCPQSNVDPGKPNNRTGSSDFSAYDEGCTICSPKDPSINRQSLSWNAKEGITPYMAKQLSKFERKIQYRFKDKYILIEALLHASYPRELAPDIYCNQRLEFLGDGLLYLLVADYLCRKYPQAPNCDLTEMRSVVVCSRTFATVALLNDFHKYIIALSPDMCIIVKGWEGKIEKDKQDGLLWRPISWNDLPTYHREESKNQGATVEVPKDLADIFESVAGAIYVDSGRLDCVWRCYYRLLKDVLDSLPKPREKTPPSPPK